MRVLKPHPTSWRVYAFSLSIFLLCVAQGHAQTTIQDVPIDPITTPPASSAAPNEQPRQRRTPSLGADIQVLYLLNSKTRDRFGSTVLSFSPGVGGITPSLNGKLGLDLSLSGVRRTHDDSTNRFFFFSIGPEYRRAYIPPQARRAIERAIQAAQQAAVEGGTAPQGGPPSGNRSFPFVPYYGASATAIYVNIKSPVDNVDGSGFGAGGSVFVGVALRERAFVEARLRGTTNVKGFNFSGVGLSLGLRF